MSNETTASKFYPSDSFQSSLSTGVGSITDGSDIAQSYHPTSTSHGVIGLSTLVNQQSLAYGDSQRYKYRQPKPKLGTYEIEETIGKGIFSVVKLAKHTITGINLAIKIIDKTCLDAENLVKVYREAVILKTLHHPNIVKLFQVMETPKLLCLVMEYLPNGEVFDYIATHGRFTETQARVKFLDVLSAVDYSHSCGIVHRDLKAENLLFDSKMNIKLIDFSFGTHHADNGCQSLLTTWCGSPPYAAPEIFKGEPYIGSKADIWSLGVVLYVMVCGMLPFDAQPLSHLKNQVLSASFRVPYWLSMTCERLIRSMLAKVPSRRPSTQEIFQHPWLIQPLKDTYQSRLISDTQEALDDPLSSTQSVPLDQKSSTALVVAGCHCSSSLISTVTTSHSIEDDVTVNDNRHPMEPGADMAADLEMGRFNEFVILIMESYGMNRSKIMESLNQRAYDHVMATYLLLGEKIRNHRYSLNLPALSEMLVACSRGDDSRNMPSSNTGRIMAHPKPSGVDSAVDMKGSVSECESNNASAHSVDALNSDNRHPSISVEKASEQRLRHDLTESPTLLPQLTSAFRQDSPAFPFHVWPDHPSDHVPPSSEFSAIPDRPMWLRQPPEPQRMDTSEDLEQSSWIDERATVDVERANRPRRTLARRKYGMFTPPACLDQLARAVIAQHSVETSDQPLDEPDDSS